MMNLPQWKKNKLNSERSDEAQPVMSRFKPVGNKQNETDGQMLLRIGRKFAWVIFVILMFDTLLDWFLGIIDLLTELLHLVIEFFEYSLEVLLEHTLNAHDHESEVIIANITILIFIYLLIRFVLKLPRLFVRLQRKTKAVWLKYKHREACNWRALSVERKIKVVAAYSVGSFCVLFLLTL